MGDAKDLKLFQGEARGNKIKISLPLSFCSSFFALQGVATFRLSVRLYASPQGVIFYRFSISDMLWTYFGDISKCFFLFSEKVIFTKKNN